MAKLIETLSVQRTEILQALGQHWRSHLFH